MQVRNDEKKGMRQVATEAMKGVLIRLKRGEACEEGWFLRKAKCSMEDLEKMVSLGYLIRIDKDVNDFMSDNSYQLTDAGWEFAWK